MQKVRLVFFLVLTAAMCRGQDAAVTALTSLTDPAKLATLQSDRAANPRLLKCVYWLNDYRARGDDPEAAIREALAANRSQPKHAELVQAGLLRNLDIAEKLGCLTPENLEKLRRGNSPMITRGPYTGEPAEVDHIVPVAVHPEFRNEIANLELMPRTLNRRKGSKMGARQWDYLRKLTSARLSLSVPEK
jgi:hypothetical protein